MTVSGKNITNGHMTFFLKMRFSEECVIQKSDLSVSIFADRLQKLLRMC